MITFIKKSSNTMLLNLSSILLVIISIGSITSKGIIEGYSTFLETISFSSLPFNLTIRMYQEGVIISYPLLNIIFFIGLFILIASSILFYKNNKVVSIILSVIDIICFAVSFLLFYNGNYLLMVGIIVTIFMLQISLESINKNKLLSVITIASSFAVWIVNIYFLIKHYAMIIGIYNVEGKILNDLIKISRTNAACIALFVVPCLIYIIRIVKSE